MKNVTTTSQRLIPLEIMQDQSIASDFNHAVDLMPEEFRQRHQELFNLLLAQLPEEEKTHVLQCMPAKGETK